MARIAGRLRLRGRADLSELVLIPNPWKPTQVGGWCPAVALAFIEAEQTEALLKLRKPMRKKAAASKTRGWLPRVSHAWPLLPPKRETIRCTWTMR